MDFGVGFPFRQIFFVFVRPFPVEQGGRAAAFGIDGDSQIAQSDLDFFKFRKIFCVSARIWARPALSIS
jgi:hypothetical protein